MFWDAQTDTQTGQKQYASGHTMLGRGIKNKKLSYHSETGRQQ